MKLLNIIVTVSRNHKNLERTLDSIDKIKQDKDISVIVLSNEINIKKDLLKRFKFESKVLQSKKNYGPLYQEALDNCKGQYATFIDADDMFDTNGTRQVIDFLKNNSLDVLRTDLAESYIGLDGKPAIGIVNYTFVETPHAHFFKLDYLEDKNIKFNEKLDVYALDNFYRNAIFNTEVKGLKLTTYLSGFTAVQYDKNHLPINVENIDEYYDSIIDTFEMLQKNNIDYYKVYLLTLVFSLFVIVESSDFNTPTLLDKKKKYEEIIYTIYNDYVSVFDEFDVSLKNSILNIEFEKQRRTNINHTVLVNFASVIERVSNIHSETQPHFLDIIVPEYNGEEFIFDFLDSLAKQKDVNFEEIGVIVVNDASPNKIKPYKFKKYGNLNIEYIFNEKNVGQGMTRQHGIDFSKAEYITMFDQDDIFYDKDDYCLSKMITELKAKKPKVAIGNVYEEVTSINGIKTRIKYDNMRTGVFVHGMYCNRQYLNDNEYRFSPKLRQLEDTYFKNTLTSTTECLYFNIDIYLWRNNRKSQVRTNNDVEFTIRHFDDFCECAVEVFEFTKNKNESYASKYIASSIFGALILSNCQYTIPIGQVRMKEMQKIAYQMYLKYRDIIEKIDIKEKKELYDDEIAALGRSLHSIKPLEPIDDFIARMAKEYPDL